MNFNLFAFIWHNMHIFFWILSRVKVQRNYKGISGDANPQQVIAQSLPNRGWGLLVYDQIRWLLEPLPNLANTSALMLPSLYTRITLIWQNCCKYSLIRCNRLHLGLRLDWELFKSDATAWESTWSSSIKMPRDMASCKPRANCHCCHTKTFHNPRYIPPNLQHHQCWAPPIRPVAASIARPSNAEPCYLQ